jgi:thiamine transport system ATP-binding protein
MLAVERAVVRFGERTVLDGIDLAVGTGETVAVLGPSGSGKSTLLRVIAGLQPLDAGRVTWDGVDLAPMPPHRRQFGLMFQEYALFPHRDVAGNVEFGLRMAGLDKPARADRVDRVLDLVGMEELRHQRVATLSGGEQQRVALARALAVSPRLLMLDEPLGALDRSWRNRLLLELRSMLDRLTLAAVYVTHDHDEALTIASKVAVMRDGRVVQSGAPADVWRAPVDAWVATFLGFGPCVDAQGRSGVLRTPWGDIDAPERGTAGATDGAMQIVLRPDAVDLCADGAFAATVERVTFAGTGINVVLHPDAGPQLQCTVAGLDAPAAGARVRWSLDAGAVLCYPNPAD